MIISVISMLIFCLFFAYYVSITVPNAIFQYYPGFAWEYRRILGPACFMLALFLLVLVAPWRAGF